METYPLGWFYVGVVDLTAWIGAGRIVLPEQALVQHNFIYLALFAKSAFVCSY